MTHSNRELDDLFDLARGSIPEPDPALFAAILADADMVLAEKTVAVPAKTIPWWRQIFADMGGWPAVTGLVSAGVFGVWVGFYGDSVFDTNLNPFSTSTELTDPFSGLDLSYLEG